MSEHSESATILRNNEARCVRMLAACRRFAVNASGASGNYATLAQNEEVLLRSFEQVVEAHASPDGRYADLFAQRCQKAGLTPADVRLLQTLLQQSAENDDL